jgi:Sec-independent protein translocase protein TatA
MALSPIEWIVGGIIVLALIIWGPSKIPELTRELGRAKKRIRSGYYVAWFVHVW